VTLAGVWRRVAGTKIVWLAALLWGITAAAPAETWIYVTEHPLPNGVEYPEWITTGSDGALWFTASYIGRMTTAGKVTLYSVRDCCGSDPGQITPGPDGALWFTLGTDFMGSGTGAIGRITTSGVPTGYELPTGTTPLAITAGPDGALWFTQYPASIGRITTAGVITAEYPVPAPVPPDTQLLGLAAGSDGALWFTAYQANQIGRITTSGAITEYPVPTANSEPFAITPGPDGALWFTEQSGNKIGRITTAGAITEYPVPTANSYLNGIVTGSDGALWFAETYGDPERDGAIGRITTAGVITEYPAPNPGAITTGPNGALWFTNYYGNKIESAPACGLGFSASFAGSTLTMNFDLGTSIPATWYANLVTSTAGVKQLWSRPMPAIGTPTPVTLTFGPGFPEEGPVTIVSGLQIAPNEGLCYETATVNTGP
jgi:virginiamycin B lyase